MMHTSPPENIVALPDEQNILVWYYVLEGPPDTPYQGGMYLGKIKFPPDYPFAPPSIIMTTPNGRFKTDTRLCLSISDFHPKEWNPVWNVSTILTGLLSFMVSGDITFGSLESSNEYKQELAVKTHSFNITQPMFKKLFPAKYEVAKRIVEEQHAPSALPSDVNSGTSDASFASSFVQKIWRASSRYLQVVMVACTAVFFWYTLTSSAQKHQLQR
jgi:ubiquitin-conjugating enzyme E2 J2